MRKKRSARNKSSVLLLPRKGVTKEAEGGVENKGGNYGELHLDQGEET